MQHAHTKAATYLRNLFISEHRAFYLSECEKDPLSFDNNVAYTIRNNARAKAWGRATTRLKKKYPAEYRECLEQAFAEGYLPAYRARGV